ncbi:MAG: hypothetical protein ACREN2_04255 [Candidatus Dormibacteria bacterium]
MSGFRVRTLITLDSSVSARRNGWRGVCEFGGIVSESGDRLFGFEAIAEGTDQLLPGKETDVTLRLWAPMPAGLTAPRSIRLFDGGTQVAMGHVSAVLPTDRDGKA